MCARSDLNVTSGAERAHASPRTRPRRVVSLVPSLTEAVAWLGRGDRLVGVTSWCSHGAPAHAERLRGTKNPDLRRLRTLAPDLVLANREENRVEHLEALRADGVSVLESFPRTVADVDGMLAELGRALDAEAAASALRADLAAARRHAAATAPAAGVPALTLIWRRPWMALGADTYASALLAEAGFSNVAADLDGRYPKLADARELAPRVVLLPSEPYAFTDADLDAVGELLGDPHVPCRFVDGQTLTWHGTRTAEALRAFSRLAADLAATG